MRTNLKALPKSTSAFFQRYLVIISSTVQTMLHHLCSLDSWELSAIWSIKNKPARDVKIVSEVELAFRQPRTENGQTKIAIGKSCICQILFV